MANGAASILAALVESSDDAIVSKTLDGIVTSWNPAAERIFGYSAVEMIGHPITRLFPAEMLPEEAQILRRLRRGERIDHYETERVSKDGRTVAVSVSVSPIRDSTGAIIGAAKIARDISDRRKDRARLEELQAELAHVSRLNDMGQLASAFAHELNQPLSAISNYVSGARTLLERGDTALAAEGCDRAQREVATAGQVVRRLRDFVKKSEAQRRVEDLPPVIEDALSLARISARGVRLEVESNVASTASRAIMDRIQIQQVLVNLMRNAIEAMVSAPAPRLSIGTQRSADDLIEVAVGDTGPGLSDAVKSKLFQPFNTTKSEGLGVGLALCRTIVEDHGGTIWAENHPGGGAVFRFTLQGA